MDKHRIYSRIYPWVVIACGAFIMLGLGLSGHYRTSIVLIILVQILEHVFTDTTVITRVSPYGWVP